MPKIWPIDAIYYPFVHTLKVDGHINSYGSGYEQRIVTDYARGPRADGEGGLTKYVGTNMFSVKMNNMLLTKNPHPSNAEIESSVVKLWQFYKSCFYDPATGRIGWDPFYFYSVNENDNVETWTGDVVSAGDNSRGVAVNNRIGRYLVRFQEPSLSITRFRTCLFNQDMAFQEVAA